MHILHCDLDAFFASVEQRDHPELKGKPVVIGAPPNSRGVVSTCSYEARKYGIRSAQPSSQAYRLCPQAIFLLPDMKRYQEASRQVFNILADYTPVIEALSIDEAFLDLSGSHMRWGSSREIGSQIRQRVRDELGLNISVGIAANKFQMCIRDRFHVPLEFFINCDPLYKPIALSMSAPEDFPFDMIPQGKAYPFMKGIWPQFFYVWEDRVRCV